MADENPFRKALEQGQDQLQPFSRDALNLRKQSQLRTLRDLDLATPEVLDRNPKVADLTVHDLNDLAREFTGVPTRNEKIADLSLEDIQDIEGVFLEFKVAAVKDLARVGRGDLASVDVSCCCCTPCCCCAAADMSETA